jgi:hypothetical protein
VTTGVSADQPDLAAVLLFVAVGLLLTAAFFTAGYNLETKNDSSKFAGRTQWLK